MAVHSTAVFAMILTTRDGYVIDRKYLHHLATKVSPADAVKFRDVDSIQGHEDMKDTAARFEMRLSAATPGNVMIAGTLGFSICKTKKDCSTQEVEVEVPAAVVP